MAANNLYFPQVARTYTMTKDHYIVINDKKTGLPRKINVVDFFAEAEDSIGIKMNINDLSLGINPFVGSTAYDAGSVMYERSPTTGHRTIYRRIAAGTSAATFTAVEEALYLPLSSLGGNSWDMSGIAFVSPTGDDATAVLGDGNKPYKTFSAAFAASLNVYALPGTYSGQVNMPNGVSTVYAPTGVVFGSGFKFYDTAATGKEFTLLGNAVFASNSEGIWSAGDAVMNINCHKFDDVQIVGYNLSTGTLNINCDHVLANCFNGGGYAMSARSTSVTNVNVKNYFYSQHKICSFSSNFSGSYTYTCPDTKIIPNYTSNYGTVGKSMWDLDANSGAKIIINTRSENADLTSTNADAVVRVASTTDPTPTTFIHNGDMIGGSTPVFKAWFAASYGDYIFNGDMTSNDAVLSTALSGWATAANLRIRIKNSRMQGGLSNVIGKGKEVYITNSSVEITGAGAHVFIADASGLDAQILYLYDSTIESAGAFETFNNFGSTSIGCKNVESTLALGVGAVDSFGGFTTNASIITPKL